MKRTLRGFAIFAVTIGIVLLGLETLCRTALRSPQMEPENLQPAAGRDFARAAMLEPYFEHDLKYRGRPEASVTVYGIEYRHDRLGLRARSTASPPDPLRVLVLGDSNTYGWRVAEDATFCAVAERLANEDTRSRPVEFVNAGLPGYNTRDALGRYLSLREEIRPDVVLLAWFVNDCEPYGFDVDDAGFLYFDPIAPPPSLRRLLWRSYAYRFLTLRKTAAMRSRGELSTDDPAAFRFSVDRIRELAARVGEDGARFAVLDVPLLEPAPGEQRMSAASYRERDKSERLSSACEKEGIPYCALLPALEGEPVALLWGSIEHDDHHPNARAHERFAGRIVAFLDELGWLR